MKRIEIEPISFGMKWNHIKQKFEIVKEIWVPQSYLISEFDNQDDAENELAKLKQTLSIPTVETIGEDSK